MREQRYMLTIQNNDILKEIDVSKDTPIVKIGTMQDSDVRLKRDLFDLPVSVTLSYDGSKWRLACAKGLYMSLPAVRECSETVIGHGDILTIHSSATKANLLTLALSYDFTAGAKDFDTIIDIRNVDKIVIGNSKSAQIRLESEFIDSEYITLVRDSDRAFLLDARNAQNSATLNGLRLFDDAKIQEYDFIGIADYSFYYKNGVLYTTMREDMSISGISSQPLRDETPAFDYPKLNRSPRMLYNFNDDPIEILNPPKKPEKPRDNLILQLSPALLMIAVTVITRGGLIGGLGSGNPLFLIFSLSMIAVGIFTSIMSFFYNKKRYRDDIATWKSDYNTYIADKCRQIEIEQGRELLELKDIYPNTESVRDLVKTFSGRIFERSPQDVDFLHIRAGLGSTPAMRRVVCRREEHIKVENELSKIPEQICDRYAFIDDAPVMLHLRESGSVGVVGTSDDQYEFFKNMLLDLCVMHDYEEVQIVALIPEGEQEKYNWIKWLPHIKEAGGEVRGIVCDDDSRDNVLEHLYALMSVRSSENIDSGQSVPLPYIVVFVMEEYGIKTHPLFKFAEESADLGLSFVFFKQYVENLPRHCEEIVELNPKGGVIKLSQDKTFERAFVREQVKDESIQFVAERLAPVFCEQIALSSRLTSNITLFELLNIISPEDLDLTSRWAKSDVQKSLTAPLGIDAKGGHVDLDLHERSHGPHGLVAGTTGSGKSEIMQSYILSAAVNFHPYEVSFVVIDFKGGGMANQFDGLPHLVGKITDIDKHEIHRSLLSIRAELEKRKRLFAQYDVNHIDSYIAMFRSGIAKVPLPHLILIVDEFAELKSEHPEFMKELISTARVGRSLGIHLILATQKPAGQVNEQIWSNSRFKLCLKVATKEDSNEVLRSPLASEIRGPGRAYLQVGNNEIFTLFQSAYSGASATSDKSGSMREFEINEVSFTGKRSVIYEKKAERSGDGSKITQLRALVEYVAKYCEGASIARLPSICLPPLPEIIDYMLTNVTPSNVTTVGIGIYDDPGNQIQPEVKLILSEGNVMIIGSAQTGKTMLLQTILRAVAENYAPEEVSVYILDFASKVLKTYEGLNHVGGVLTDAEDEVLKNFFKMIHGELSRRKELFSRLGVSSYEAFREMEGSDLPDIPHIIVMVDNLSAFREIFPEYEDAMLNLCREGSAMGITVVATSKQTSGLSYRYFSNFSTRIAFNCNESSEYNNIFDRCPIRPKDLPGRGLVAIDKVVYEYQAYLPFSGDTESQRIEQAKAFIDVTESEYGARRARAVPRIPSTLTEDYWQTSSSTFGEFEVPVGLTYNEIEPVTVNLARVGSVGIYGREGFGKSNLVRLLLNHLYLNVFDLPCRAYLIDSYDRQLAEYETYGFVERYTVDYSEFEEVVQVFSDEANARMKQLKIGVGIEDEPLLLCVVQNSQVFAENKISKETADQFKRLADEARQLKICFIFSDIDNNSEYSPPEMMRIAREFHQHFFLDDMENVKFLGASKFTANDLRQFKKAIALGDGYSYNSRRGIEKIKLVKCERGV